MKRPSASRTATTSTNGNHRNRFSILNHLSPSSRQSRGTDAGGPSPPSSPTTSEYLEYLARPFYGSSKLSGPLLRSQGASQSSPPAQTDPDIPPPQEHVPPPTTNKLDGKEKAMRLKKARKLSKVFGDVPLPHKLPANPPVAPLPNSRHKRSKSLAAGKSPESTTEHFSRRPSQPEVGVPPESHERRSGIGTSLLPAPPEPGLMAFLKSIAIPSPPSHRAASSSASMPATAHHSATSLLLPKGNTGASTCATRRRSLDGIDPKVVSGDRTPSRSSSKKGIKRSRSLAHKNGPSRKVSQETLEFRARYNDAFGSDSEMSRRQKALNVQRARKMAKVFGQDPPSNLIYIADDTRTFEQDNSNSVCIPPTPALPDTTAVQEDDSDEERREHQRLNNGNAAFSSDFRHRRRRAEKLSRFFGVAYQNIEVVAPPTPDRQGDLQVDVTVTGRRFWAFDERTREADMADVMDKLRGLKAT